MKYRINISRFHKLYPFFSLLKRLKLVEIRLWDDWKGFTIEKI
jgi:hypothetical protein